MYSTLILPVNVLAVTGRVLEPCIREYTYLYANVSVPGGGHIRAFLQNLERPRYRAQTFLFYICLLVIIKMKLLQASVVFSQFPPD